MNYQMRTANNADKLRYETKSGAATFFPPTEASTSSVDESQELLTVTGSWQQRALCRLGNNAEAIDPEIFYPTRRQENSLAKAVCRRCLVTSECLEAALSANEPYGIWGGMDEVERQQLKSRRHK